MADNGLQFSSDYNKSSFSSQTSQNMGDDYEDAQYTDIVVSNQPELSKDITSISKSTRINLQEATGVAVQIDTARRIADYFQNNHIENVSELDVNKLCGILLSFGIYGKQDLQDNQNVLIMLIKMGISPNQLAAIGNTLDSLGLSNTPPNTLTQATTPSSGSLNQ